MDHYRNSQNLSKLHLASHLQPNWKNITSSTSSNRSTITNRTLIGCPFHSNPPDRLSCCMMRPRTKYPTLQHRMEDVIPQNGRNTQHSQPKKPTLLRKCHVFYFLFFEFDISITFTLLPENIHILVIYVPGDVHHNGTIVHR